MVKLPRRSSKTLSRTRGGVRPWPHFSSGCIRGGGGPKPCRMHWRAYDNQSECAAEAAEAEATPRTSTPVKPSARYPSNRPPVTRQTVHPSNRPTVTRQTVRPSPVKPFFNIMQRRGVNIHPLSLILCKEEGWIYSLSLILCREEG